MNDNQNVTNIKEFGVKMIRLVTGEDVMAETSMNTETGGLILKNPVLVQMVANKTTGSADLGMGDWLPLMAGDSVEINGMTMIALYEPQKVMSDHYLKSFANKAPNVIQPKVPGLIGIKK